MLYLFLRIVKINKFENLIRIYIRFYAFDKLKFYIDLNVFLIYGLHKFQVPGMGVIGNPVRIRDGPAAVIEDERCIYVTGFNKAGKAQQLE